MAMMTITANLILDEQFRLIARYHFKDLFHSQPDWLIISTINYALRGMSSPMQKKLFSIGEVSKIKGVTKKALRFYERIGLLKPHYINPFNRYRYYSIEQFVYIDII